MTTTSSNNFTGLYGGSTSAVLPTTPYGNANVVGLLASGTDGANTVGNIVASGNVTGVYFIGDGSQLTNVTATAALYGNLSGNIAGNGFSLNNIQTESIVGNLTVGGNIIANTAGRKIYANTVIVNQQVETNDLYANTISSTGEATIGGDLSVTGNVLVQGGDDVYLTVNSGAVLDLPASGNVTLAPGGSGNTSITLLGNTRISGNITYPINALANISTSGYFLGDGSLLTNLPAGNYNNTNVATFLSSGTVTSNIITTANVSGSYILGDGSQLTNLPAGNYNNANVSTFLAAFGSNTISTTGNVTAGYFIGNGSALTGLPAGYSNANVSTYLASGTNTANIITTGNVTGGNITTTGQVTAGGNVSGANIGTAGVVSATGNILGGNITTAGVVSATGNILGGNVVTGNVYGGNLVSTDQNGWLIYGNSTALSAAPYINIANITPTMTISVPGTVGGKVDIGPNVQISGYLSTTGNVLTTGLISAAGNITSAGNVIVSANVSATGNVSASYFIGNGSQLTGVLPSTAAGSNTQIQYNQSGVFAGDSAMTFDWITGNISLGPAGGNIITGKVLTSGNIINSTNAWNPNSTPQSARLVIGNGYNGDYSATYDPLSITRGSQLSVMNKQQIGNADTNQSIRNVTSMLWTDLGGATLTNNNRRIQSMGGVAHVGNGTITLTSGQVSSLSGSGGSFLVGNIGNTTMGNATISHASGLFNGVVAGTGANIGNAFAVSGQVNSVSATGNVVNAIAYVGSFAGSPTVAPTTVVGYYMGNSSAPGSFGASNSNTYRSATNYYFLRNDDPVAQNQLGSLRSYTEYDYINSTSGSLTIDKNNGQVQQINLTGNVTSLTFSNFVTSASDSVNTDYQVDTVTLIFNQGSTGGYGVTFPTASSTVKYAGNVTALQSTAANSVSLVSVSAANIASATTYLITISPGFV